MVKNMNIFYNKQTLLDTLVGITDYSLDLIEKKLGDTTLFLKKDTNELMGFNILNVSKYISLNDGRQILTNDLKQFISSKCECDFNQSKSGFIVGKIIECENVEGTHLSKCVIDINQDEHLKIVCGGENARTGILVVVAMVGTIMPSGLLIEESYLRGFISQGMLCSATELSIKDLSPKKGIIELDSSYKIGEIFKPAYAEYQK